MNMSRAFVGVSITSVGVAFLTAVLTALPEHSSAYALGGERTPAAGVRKPITGLVPAPKELPGGLRWQIVTLRPRGGIYCFDLSPDARLAVFADGPTVRICGTEDFVLRQVLAGHRARVGSVAWSPDGTRIATASIDGTARIWKADGSPLAELCGHTDAVTCIVWRRDGKQLATSGRDGTVRLWTSDGKPGRVIHGFDAGVTCVAFSPDGSRLVTGDENRLVRIWRIDGTLIAKCEGHHGPIHSVDWSPNGKAIVSGCQGYVPRDGQGGEFAFVRIWDPDGRFLRSLDGHLGHVDSVRFNPDGSKIATTAEDGRVRIWSTADGTLLTTANCGSNAILRWTPDGTQLYVAYLDAILTVDPFGNANNRVSIEVPLRFERALWRFGGASFATLTMDSDLRVFDASGRSLLKLNTGMNPYGNKDVGWRPDGKEILAVGYGDGAPVYNAEGKELRRLSTKNLRFAQWSPDGKSILAVGDQNAFVISPDGKKSSTFAGHQKRIESIAWSPDGKRFATGSCDSTIRIWDLDGGGIKVLQGDAGDVDSVAWSPDGRWVASGMDDGSWRLWKPDGTEGPGQPGRSEVMSVAFSPDSRRLATGTWDGTLCVWDIGGNRPICALAAHQGPIMSIKWSPDGKHILSASRDNTVRMWNAETFDCQLVILKMTDGTTTTFSAAGELLDGNRESLEQDVRYVVERDGETPRLMTLAQFQQISAPGAARH
jgi:WD40 repeat protein